MKRKLDKKSKAKLYHFYPIMKSLCDCSCNEQRQIILNNLSSYSLNMLCECVLNVMSNPSITTIEMRNDIRNKIGQKKDKLRKLVFAQMQTKSRRCLCRSLIDDICFMLQYIVSPLEKNLKKQKDKSCKKSLSKNNKLNKKKRKK